LFALVEGRRAIDGIARGASVFGLALAALIDEAAVLLGSFALPGAIPTVNVELSCLDENGESRETAAVRCLVTAEDVDANRDWIIERVDNSLISGVSLIERLPIVFPLLRLGETAREQIEALTGTEVIFRQLIKHLRALNQGARNWLPDVRYAPATAISWGPESRATLEHGRFGPMRDFPVPEGFAASRWTYHTKLTGNGGGFRLYFRPERTPNGPVVLIGYFGPHLPTVEYPT